jgi:hypothetical protein
MSNKIESIVILTGILSVLVGIITHLYIRSRQAKREAQAEYAKSLESISAIKKKMIDDNQNIESIKLSGTLESSRDFPSAIKETPKKKAKKKETSKPVYTDYLVEEDKELLRRVERNEGDFVTSMLVAQATDSALLGSVVGGDPVGAIVGDMLNDSDSKTSIDYSDSPSHDSSWDTTDSTDYSSSSDSWSSSDSSSFDSSSSDW